MLRFPALLSFATALAYLGAGGFFLNDPSSAHPNGSDAYWQALADGSLARSGFLFCFGVAGLFAIGVIPALRRFLDLGEGHPATWGVSLGLLGYAVTSVTYFRLLAGEPARAQAVAGGSDVAAEVIQSFSLSLDTQGWLIFGCVGAFLVAVNLAAWMSRRLPVALCLLGLVCGGLNFAAFAGLVLGSPDLVKLAAGAGGIVFGPIWWIWLGIQLWRAPAQA